MRVQFKAFSDLRGSDWRIVTDWLEGEAYERLRVFNDRGCPPEELPDVVADPLSVKGLPRVLRAVSPSFEHKRLGRLNAAEKLSLVGPMLEHLGEAMVEFGSTASRITGVLDPQD